MAEEITEKKDELLPLDAAERVASYRRGGRVYRHVFKRILAADWDHFYRNVLGEVRRDKKGFEQVIDTEYASTEFYTRIIRAVEGFRTEDGRKPEELANWPECIAHADRILAVDVLMRAGAEMPGDLAAEMRVVTIRAFWNCDEAGAMKEYAGLRHVFRVPRADHFRRFARAKNRTFVEGGSRRGVTVIPSNHGILIQLYDELIERAEGYAAGGRPLAEREEIIREMDAMHKIMAANQLFNAPAVEDEAEADAA